MLGGVVVSLKTKIYKTLDYIRTYGFIKGIKAAKKEYKFKKKNLKEMNQEIQKTEDLVKPILDKYKSSITFSFGEDQQNIFVFWWDGFDKAPEIVKTCLKSIKKTFSKFKIIEIDQYNYSKYSDIDPMILERFNEGSITIQTFSDILRFNLLKSNGGLWIDSTVLVLNLNENQIIDKIRKDGFFSIYEKGTASFISYKNVSSSWSIFLMGGVKNSPLFQCMSESYLTYLKEVQEKPTYFLTDIFLMLCKVYGVSDSILSSYDGLNTEVSLFYIMNRFSKKVNKEDYEIISKMNIQKLIWKIDSTRLKENSLYKVVIDKFDIK